MSTLDPAPQNRSVGRRTSLDHVDELRAELVAELDLRLGVPDGDLTTLLEVGGRIADRRTVLRREARDVALEQGHRWVTDAEPAPLDEEPNLAAIRVEHDQPSPG